MGLFGMGGKPAAKATMRAVQIVKYGEVDGLQTREIPTPQPGPGQVLVKIHAAGVNPFDVKIRVGRLAGFYPLELPSTAGADFAGEVVALGKGAKRLKVGDRVYGMVNPMQTGTYAEYIAVDETLARLMPKHASYEEAAAVPMGGQTAYYALHPLGGVRKGDKVLVHAGAGGVGGMAIQIAKAAGATVYATCSTRNIERCKKLGADVVIDYTTTDFRTVCKDIDLAIDPLGDDVNLHTYEVMRKGGTILVVLRYNKVEMENRDAMVAKYGVKVKVVEFDNEPETLDALAKLMDSGKVKADVGAVLPLSEAAEAQTRSGSGHISGKIVLKVI